MTISEAKKLLEKVATRLTQQRANSRALHMKNENFKALVVKPEVNVEDKTTFEALLQSSKMEI